MTPSLPALARCFQGLIPAAIATCAADGTPNITFISQVHYVDPTHVALSHQFFNKTKRNVAQNPHACVEVMDPLTFEAWKLRVRFSRSESAGPLFEAMDLRIQAIASVTGMGGVFKLIGADVYEVLSIERMDGFLAGPPAPAEGPEFSLRQILGVQIVSQQINRARDLDETLEVLLATLDQVCGFGQAMMLLPDESGRRLVAIASRGYGEEGLRGIGAEVAVGEGFIGAAAEQRQVLRISNVEGQLRYGRAVRQRMEATGEKALRPEIPLPGLPGVQSQLALPLVVQDRLVGVLALESRDPLAFGTWDEALLQILANQIAVVVDHNATRDDEEAAGSPAPAPAPAPGARHAFTFFRNDDCVFVDGEYLIRNVPGKILWKLLTAFQRDGRTEFSNRELRLDPWLGLPPVKNNLESRLILLRKRLEQQCPDVRLVPVRRGRFALEVGCAFELVEK
ncbi:MAG TPA: GAF domain-containing protein, partial [Polyangia bacterium]|nr:GAF domain-containing protein [Polyangia bacterium]